ncbi:hypothetical protein SLITO_v1c02680 [Spiroplasma litorale]|uniref:Uncharacterized protein n=1 Tax=Spiroplasma litorale TaxID=216942 RepID=A0A0K1W176_9MOLU|nr:hypothetical protein [Spiroplasma litorale]AKX33923.1 hypothetical protein SLITO_v1c02680 [Spiroplasma litorale]
MIINIGPWWLFDIICFFIIITSTVCGIRKGFLVLFYFLFLQILLIVILLFVPALITNAIAPSIMRALSGLNPSKWFSGVSSEIVNLINGLLPNNEASSEAIKTNGDNVSYEMAKTVVALVIYLLICIFFYITINLIGFFVYLGFRKKIRSIKIFGKVDALLGAVNGLFLGMTLSIGISFIASFPLIATENQKIGALNFKDMNSEDLKDYINNENAYSKYSISKRINSGIPSIPTYNFTYTNVCAMKYVVKPITIIGTEQLKDGTLSSLSDFFIYYEDELVEGYSTDNLLKVPVNFCIESMPNDSRNLFRIVSEIMLMGSKLYVEGNEPEKTTLHSINLINAFDKFYYEKIANDKNDQGVHKGWVNEDNLVKFYEWAEENSNGNEEILKRLNPFIQLSENIKNSWRKNSNSDERKIVSLLQNPKRTYNFLKNLFYVNYITRNNLDTLPTLSSTLSSLYLFRAMELSPTGELKLGRFKDHAPGEGEEAYNFPTIDDIVYNSDKFWNNYNKRGYMWTRYYFSFLYNSAWGFNE